MATSTKSTAKVRPIEDRILVKPEEAEEKTAGGILLPDTAKERPLRGKVIAAGPGKLLESGKRAPITLRAGDRVMYGKYTGSEVKIEGVVHTILRESEILAVLE
jgi:chaperonin GroES